LKAFKGHAVRPTADRVKEALFNILARDLSGMRVLDLFAGTGNVTIEALSRGAGEACLVEQSRKAARMIRANLQSFGFAPQARVLVMPALRAVRSLSAGGATFDFIFVDPPYDRGWVDKILGSVASGELLAADGILVVEHSAREKAQEKSGGIELRDERRYGDTVLSFFGRTSASPL